MDENRVFEGEADCGQQACQIFNQQHVHAGWLYNPAKVAPDQLAP